jgi:large subunit ribosomal protein L23
VLKPVISEKAYNLSGQSKYTFKVDKRANKVQIKKAIEEIFNVSVISVNTSMVRGKLRRRGLTRGYKPDWKKAVVTLKPGQKIEIFEGGS